MPRKTYLKKSVRRKRTSRKKFNRRVYKKKTYKKRTYKKKTYKKRTYKKKVSRIHKIQYGGAEQLTSKTMIGDKLLTAYRLRDAVPSSWETDIRQIAENPVLVVDVGRIGWMSAVAVEHGFKPSKYEIYIISKIEVPQRAVFELTCDRYRYDDRQNKYIKDGEKVVHMFHSVRYFDYSQPPIQAMLNVGGNLQYKLYTNGSTNRSTTLIPWDYKHDDIYEFFILDLGKMRDEIETETGRFSHWQHKIGLPCLSEMIASEKYKLERDWNFLIAKNKYLIALYYESVISYWIKMYQDYPVNISRADADRWRTRFEGWLSQNSIQMQKIQELEKEYEQEYERIVRLEAIRYKMVFIESNMKAEKGVEPETETEPEPEPEPVSEDPSVRRQMDTKALAQELSKTNPDLINKIMTHYVDINAPRPDQPTQPQNQPVAEAADVSN